MPRIESLERTAKKFLVKALDLVEEAFVLVQAVGELFSPAAGKQPPRQQVKEEEVGEVPPSEPMPEGPMVARVAGEKEVLTAPVPLTEERVAPFGGWVDRSVEELPPSYQDDTFRALVRDPTTIWVVWDFARSTVEEALRGLESPRAKLRILQEDTRFAEVDFALESGSYYLNDLTPGKRYVVEIVFVGTNGERRVGAPSNPVLLPSMGPSPIIDDRFATLPLDSRISKGLDLLEESVVESDEGRLDLSFGVSRPRGASEAHLGGSERHPRAGSGTRFGRLGGAR